MENTKNKSFSRSLLKGTVLNSERQYAEQVVNGIYCGNCRHKN